MKVVSMETIVVEIPFTDGGRGEGLTPTSWRSLETVLVRLVDDRGNVGWGEGFGYFTAAATKAVIDRLIAPLVIGCAVEDIAAWNRQVQQRLSLFGRYGITIFALSGVDIALWDLLGRRNRQPLAALLGQSSGRELRQSIPCYASLVRYGDIDTATRTVRSALDGGFTDIKLHEITRPEIEACRRAAGPGVPMSIDVNCNWSLSFSRDSQAWLKELDASWLEEPIFPPEDFRTLASLRGAFVPIAAGENWCTSIQFEEAFRAGAVDFAQPSITKVGGVTEFLEVDRLACGANVPLLPHSPYFGPGFLATIHAAAALPSIAQLEYLFVTPDAWLCDIGALIRNGQASLPDGFGLGFSPNADVIQRYRV